MASFENEFKPAQQDGIGSAPFRSSHQEGKSQKQSNAADYFPPPSEPERMSSRGGAPKHQNRYAWKPKAGIKINETEVGGRLRPLSEITGVCPRCKEQIDWKRRYGKYKPLSEPAKCQSCTKRNVRQAYHNLCNACAKEQKVCAKCRCQVACIVGRDLSEVEAEQKALEEAIKYARERERRTLLRAMNKGGGKSESAEQSLSLNENKVGDLFPSATLEGYAAKSRCGVAAVGVNHDDDEEEEDEDDAEDQEDEEDDDEGNHKQH